MASSLASAWQYPVLADAIPATKAGMTPCQEPVLTPPSRTLLTHLAPPATRVFQASDLFANVKILSNPDSKLRRKPTQSNPRRVPLKRRALITLALAAAVLATLACTRFTPNGGWSAPVAAGGWIYVAADNGELVRVDPTTGVRDQAFFFPPSGGDDLGKAYGAPLVTEDAVYAAAYDCAGDECQANVYAVDRETGRSLWASPDAAAGGNFPQTFGLETEIVGALAKWGDLLIFGTSKVGEEDQQTGYLYGIDASDDFAGHTVGRFKWRFPVSGKIWSTPAIHEGVAYVTTMDGYVYAIDLSEDLADQPVFERELWRWKSGGAIASSPVIQNGKLLLGDFDGDFYALDLKARAADRSGENLDSSREWKFDGSAWIWARGVVDGNTVYVSTLNGEIFALDLASGRPLWTSPGQIEGQIVGDPVIFSGPRGKSLAVASGEQDVWVIDMATGDDVGKFDTNAGVKASPAVTDDFIFVYTLDEELQWFSRGDLARRGCLKMPSGEVCG